MQSAVNSYQSFLLSLRSLVQQLLELSHQALVGAISADCWQHLVSQQGPLVQAQHHGLPPLGAGGCLSLANWAGRAQKIFTDLAQAALISLPCREGWGSTSASVGNDFHMQTQFMQAMAK